MEYREVKELHIRCLECGCKLLFNVPGTDGEYIASSEYIEEFPYCHTCMVEYCCSQDCETCERKDKEECSFKDMKEYYLQPEED
jgi:hypothetical protein